MGAQEMSEEDAELRARFEAWITASPYERDVARFRARAAWPNQYKDYITELAWCAWQESAKKDAK